MNFMLGRIVNISLFVYFLFPVSLFSVEINAGHWEKLTQGSAGIVLYQQKLVRENSIVTSQLNYVDDKDVDFVMQRIGVVGKEDGQRIYEITVYVKKTSNIPYAVSVSGDLVSGVVQINRTAYGKYKNETIIELGMLQQSPGLVLELDNGVYLIRN